LTVEYDKDLDILYIRLNGEYALSEEINENAIIDLDSDRRILAIDASDFFGRANQEDLQSPGSCSDLRM
jgi:uncharacterized protein YuzE